MKSVLAVIIAAALQAPAASPQGEEKAAPSAKPAGSTIVSGLTVTARPSTLIDGMDVIAPKLCKFPKIDAASRDAQVVSTYPAFGDIVPSGPILVRVTYDRPMSPCGFIFNMHGVNPPTTLNIPAMLSPDRRSFLFAMDLGDGEDFQISFNPMDYHWPRYFRTASGGYGLAYTLTFRSHVRQRAKSLADAARQDPLFDALNHQPGRIAVLGIPRPGDPLLARSGR